MSELKISLASARVNARLTQDEVAKLLKVSNKTVGNWEKGKTIPSLATMYMLSDLYRIPINNIFLPAASALSERQE